MKKLRLLVTESCNRSCAGCCNKQWDLKKLPIAKDFDGYDMIMVTGGEPLQPSKLAGTLDLLKRMSNLPAAVYVYTACAENVIPVLGWTDGVTLTLHEQADVAEFLKLNSFLLGRLAYRGLSLRLNVFNEVALPAGLDLSLWKVKLGIRWIEDCPLPADEEFARLEDLL